MSKLDELVAQKDDIVDTFSKYVCDGCLPKLERVGLPIKNRLDSGKSLRLRDVKSLVKCVCPKCLARIRQNSKGLL